MLKFFGAAGAAFVAAACLAGPAAAGGVVYDNLSSPTNAADSVYDFGPLADSFSTGAGGFNVSEVQLLLSGQAAGGQVTVSLLADNGTSPGAVIATTGPLADSFLTGATSVADFQLSASLAANTRYWVQISEAGADSAGWAWTKDMSGVGVAGEYFAGGGGVYPNTEGPYQMAVLSGAVPEPATWAMLILGVAMVGFAARTRRTAAFA